MGRYMLCRIEWLTPCGRGTPAFGPTIARSHKRDTIGNCTAVMEALGLEYGIEQCQFSAVAATSILSLLPPPCPPSPTPPLTTAHTLAQSFPENSSYRAMTLRCSSQARTAADGCSQCQLALDYCWDRLRRGRDCRFAAWGSPWAQPGNRLKTTRGSREAEVNKNCTRGRCNHPHTSVTTLSWSIVHKSENQRRQ